MQWIAENPVLIAIRSDKEAIYDSDGRLLHPKRRRLFAKFQRSLAPGWAREVGLKTFEFRNLPERGVTKEQWLSFYDSVMDQAQNGWTDEERKVIEEKLLTRPDIVLVERPKAQPPWPKYVAQTTAKGQRTIEKVVELVLRRIEEDGYSAEDVAAFERDAERKESAAILEAVAALDTKEEEEEPLVAA